MQYDARGKARSAHPNFGNSTWRKMVQLFSTARLSKAMVLSGGALCAAGLAIFVAGAWAGVTRSWPVRYPLQLIEGHPNLTKSHCRWRDRRDRPSGALRIWRLTRESRIDSLVAQPNRDFEAK